MKSVAFLCALALFAAPAVAKERTIIDPLAAGLEANNHVAAVEVVLGAAVTETMAKFEEKAAEKRTAAKPPPAGAADATRPAQDHYSTLPFQTMFPLVMEDVTRDWGLTGGRPIKLIVTIDTLKTANAGMAMLFGSSDQLAGNVQVADAATGEKLGAFYIDVINTHAGLLGLAARGGGVREALSEEFALQTSRVLAGRKSKTVKAPKKASKA